MDRTVTVGPGINMLKLNEELRPHGVFYPDDPASYPCSLVGGRIGTGGWSLLGARFGHTRDLVISMEVVLPTGEIVEIGEGGGRKLRKSSTGLNAQAAVHRPPGHARHHHRGDARAGPAAGDRVRRVLRLRRLHEGVPRRPASLTKSRAGDDRRRRALRRVEDRATCAATTRPTSRSPSRVRAVVAVAMYGRRAEVEPASKVVMELGRSRRRQVPRRRDLRRATGPRATTATRRRCTAARRTARSCRCPGTARTRRSTTPCSRRCARSGTRSSTRYSERYGIFDDWGMFAYTSGPTSRGRDYLVEIDVGIWEQKLDDENWDAWVQLQARDRRGVAQVRRLDHRLPRRDPRGRRRARADRDGQRVGGREARSSARSTPTTS